MKSSRSSYTPPAGGNPKNNQNFQNPMVLPGGVLYTFAAPILSHNLEMSLSWGLCSSAVEVVRPLEVMYSMQFGRGGSCI